MNAASSILEIINPKEISEEETIINELRDFGIIHTPSNLNSGWNYVLDHVWAVKNINGFVKKAPNSDLVNPGRWLW